MSGPSPKGQSESRGSLFFSVISSLFGGIAARAADRLATSLSEQSVNFAIYRAGRLQDAVQAAIYRRLIELSVATLCLGQSFKFFAIGFHGFHDLGRHPP
jgi:hypothetical protein